MRLLGVEILEVDCPRRAPVVTAVGTHVSRRVLFARIRAEGVDGWGECGALPEGTAVDPSIDEVWDRLLGGGVDRFLQATGSRDGILPPGYLTARLHGSASVTCSLGALLEMAVLDAEVRREGACLAERLGVPIEPVRAGAMIGIPPDRQRDTLVTLVAEKIALGYQRVRLKIEPGWDKEPVRAVHAAFPDLLLQVDANGVYRLDPTDGGAPDDARNLEALDEFTLTCIEQPLAASDLIGHATLRSRMRTPICLDESLSSLHRVTEAINYEALDVACLKPSRWGEFLAARRAQELCSAAGKSAFVGGMFETGLARTANAALVGCPGFTIPGDLSDPAEYLEEDPCPGFRIDQGRAWPERQAGIGPVPTPDILARRTLRRFAWEAGSR